MSAGRADNLSTVDPAVVEPAVVEPAVVEPAVVGPAVVTPVVNTSYHDTFSGLEHVLCGASLDGMTRLFPVYIADSINRIPDPRHNNILKASIALSFPNIASVAECQLTLYISPHKIDSLAKELFGMQLEVHAGLRYVYFAQEGTKVLPNPHLTFRGCRSDVVSRVLGTEVFEAVAACAEYRREAMQRRGRTECVSMVVTHDASQEAEISVSMGIVKAISIREQLFPSAL